MHMRTATRWTSILGILAAALAFSTGAVAQGKIEGKWTINGYNFSDQRQFPLDKMEVTLAVEPDMKISGRSGCNLYSGSMTAGPAGAMKVGAVTSTDMACQDPIGAFESEFMKVLDQASRYEVKGDTLTITDTATGHFLRFRRSDGSAPIDDRKPVDNTPPAVSEIFFISKNSAKCPIIAPSRCLLVKAERNAPWKKYYDDIIGFTFKPGRFYKIEVERVGGEPSGLPGDVTVYRHKLVRIVKTSAQERNIYR